MDVVVDGARSFKLEGEPADVMAAVVAVDKFLREKRRAILSVKADGQNIPSDDLVNALTDKPVSQVDVLEIGSEDMRTLIEDALADLEKALPDLPQACHALAEIFQGDAPEDGFEPFQELASIWSHVKSREIQVCNVLNLAFDTLELDGVSITEMHRELNQYLNEAADALKTNDCVLLGDLLEYELAPRAEAEARIVALLRSHAQGLPG